MGLVGFGHKGLNSEILNKKDTTMFENGHDTRTRDAYRKAHAERADAFARIFRVFTRH